MERSDPRSLGPEWYHPMTFSRAVSQCFVNKGELPLIFLNMLFMSSMYV
jgi:hypothetical protein